MFPMDELYTLFPLPCESFETKGIGDGIVLKFKTFYLKIYDDSESSAYIVQGFQYGKVNPVIIDRVPWTQMRKYAGQFTVEDYLTRMIILHATPHN